MLDFGRSDFLFDRLLRCVSARGELQTDEEKYYNHPAIMVLHGFLPVGA
jgi:hypothetical protein